MTVRYVIITPAGAEKILNRHTALETERGIKLNRPASDGHVARLAKDMTDGRWQKNGDTIRIAKTNRLLDGQHRLFACMLSGVSFRTYLVEGLDESAVDTIDGGRPRSASDILQMTGDHNTKRVAAAARLVIAFQRGDMKKIHLLTRTEIIGFCRANMDRLKDAVAKGHPNGGQRLITPASCVAAWYYLFAEKDAEAAGVFVDTVQDGSMLAKGDPILALRNRIIANNNQKAKLDSREIFKFGIRAWNDWRASKSRRIMKSMKNEGELPKLSS